MRRVNTKKTEIVELKNQIEKIKKESRVRLAISLLMSLIDKLEDFFAQT